MIEPRSFPSTRFTLDVTLIEATLRQDAFQTLVRDVPFEARGVLFSEMLFLRATVGSHRPGRVIESGRARGQSTYLLGLLFPDVPVVSIERYEDGEDATVASTRCRDLSHVDLRYGDAVAALPRLVEAGDVVLIDGPKGWRAVRLALTLLRDQRPSLVFIHDCHQGLPERRFLSRHVPGTFFSDDRRFEQAFAHLDVPCFEAADRDGFESWRPHRFGGRAQDSYGPTLACIPWDENVSWHRLARQASRAGTLDRMTRSWRKRLSWTRRG